jgi:hypothetical protein
VARAVRFGMRMIAPVVLLLAGTAACGGRAAPNDLPSDPAALVLRVEERHSSPRPWELGQLPGFSLYGGGRVVVASGGSDALRSAREYQLSTKAYRKLIGRAYAARLDQAGEFPHQGETDASAQIITLSTPEGVRTTRVTAPDAGGGGRDRIEDFVRGLPAAPADAATYRPSAIALLAIAGVGSEVAARPWPSSPLEQGIRTGQGLCTVVRDADPIEGVRQEESRWDSGGQVFAVVGRPLLPEEHACPDIDR